MIGSSNTGAAFAIASLKHIDPAMWNAISDESEYKYAKQSGGRGQYGHCKVRFEPMDANGEELFNLVSNLRCTNVCLNLELTEKTVNDDLKVKLTHTSADCLT